MAFSLTFVALQAELRKKEGGRLVELDGALEGKRDIFRRYRIAGCEFEAGLQLEGVGQTTSDVFQLSARSPTTLEVSLRSIETSLE